MKVRKREKSVIEEEEFKALQVINKLASAEENKGECGIFGELIATELKTLNQKQCLLAKHEIQNLDAITIQMTDQRKWQLKQQCSIHLHLHLHRLYHSSQLHNLLISPSSRLIQTA